MIRQIPIVVLSVGLMTIAGSFSGCSWGNAGELEKRASMPEKSIEQVLNERTDEWMAIPGVVGTAIGSFEGKPCIKIYTSAKPQQLQAKIPSTVENYPVIIEETGAFRALDQQ